MARECQAKPAPVPASVQCPECRWQSLAIDNMFINLLYWVFWLLSYGTIPVVE